MFMNVKYKKVIAIFIITTFSFFPLNLIKDRESNEEREWFSFYIPWNYCKDSKIDFSFLLDAPAGKHGFLTTGADGHFYFEDGKRAKFWGLNIHSNRACFPTHKQAEDVARRLAQLGCNIVRLHFLDNEAPGGIIDEKYDDSQHISDVQMEKLDYFIYQLKENGIYVCFDVLGLGARRFKPEDGIAEYDKIKFGASGISFFDENIIELSKKFAIDFLSHVNPYTGNNYLNEPAVAMVEMSNENTLFSEWVISSFTPYYRRKINDIWKEWRNKKEAGSSKGLPRNWSDDREFMFELQDGYQKNMYSYLRSIGVKVPIGSSNMPYDSLNLAADASMDFTDVHVYWDLCDRLDRMHNRPLIKQHHLNPYTILNTMSIAKVNGKPLVSTEWGSNWPNDWRAADILSTVSYAALNDWDALFLYAYNGGWNMSWDDLEKKLYYGTVIFNDPAKMGLFPIASLMFLRGDIARASDVYKVSYNIDTLFDMKDHYKDRSTLAGIPYISRLEKDFFEYRAKEPKVTIEYPNLDELSMEDGKVESDTKQIIRDFKKGIFILKTPKVVSFSGFIGEQKEQKFDGVEFYTESGFGTFTMISLDGKEISKSKSLLLSIVGRVRNKGQKVTPHITKRSDDIKRDVYILDTGKAPILVESIAGEIVLKRNNKKENLKVFSLDEKGKRKSEISTDSDTKEFSFKVSGTHNTIYYEIIRK